MDFCGKKERDIKTWGMAFTGIYSINLFILCKLLNFTIPLENDNTSIHIIYINPLVLKFL
jgi:hypothetical protein